MRWSRVPSAPPAQGGWRFPAVACLWVPYLSPLSPTMACLSNSSVTSPLCNPPRWPCFLAKPRLMYHVSGHPRLTSSGGLCISDVAHYVLISEFNLQKAASFLFPLFPGSSMEPPKAPVFLLLFIHFPFLNVMKPQQQPKTRSMPFDPAITPLGIHLKKNCRTVKTCMAQVERIIAALLSIMKNWRHE